MKKIRKIRKITVLALLFCSGAAQASSTISKSNKGVAKPFAIGFSEDSKKYDKMVRTISKRYGVSPQLTKAVIQVESNYSQFAISNAGAMGLMQLMPDTAERFGVSSVFEPSENIEGGVRYLKYLMKRFNNDMSLAIAAYNAGENRVLREKAIPPFVETQNYVRKVLALYKGEMKYIPYTM
ncbi:MAG TPA: lytic transglycosylase domain-containing protein [Acidobacteriota bacterium]|nr:lytic transglycosylase domain-containing protein [Acidobacteriota bacterium]